MTQNRPPASTVEATQPSPGPLRRVARRLNGGSDAQYRREFLPAMLAYVAVLVPTVYIVDANQDAAWRYPVTLLPMIPLAFVLVAWLRFFRRMDELQQRMQMEALAFAFGGTALITFSYGFLQSAGFPDLNWFFVWPLMTVLWIVGGVIAHRRWL